MTLPSESSAQPLGLLWMLRLTEPLPAAVEPDVPATFLRAGLADVVELATAMGLDDSEPVLERFERGCHCYIVRIEGQLVSYGWITFDEEGIGSLGLSVRLLADEAYIWDCATLATYRGQHLYPALLTYMLRELRAADLRRIWIGMDVDNRPSQAGVARAGFQPIVTILQARATAARTLLIQAYPGASEEDVKDAQYTLSGDRETNSITLLLPPL